jgi:hypothetical protein
MTSSRLNADMHADYVRKVNSVLEAGQDELAHELADAFAVEATGAHAVRRPAGRHSPARGDRRRPASRLGHLTRRSWERFDRYTLDVFNARTPYRDSDRSA